MQNPTQPIHGPLKTLSIAKFSLVFSILAAISAHAQQAVMVGWNPNLEPDISGYSVLIGTASGTFDAVRDVGSAVTTTWSNLSPGTTYYCTVQAYNSAGMKSASAAEIVFTTLPPGEHFGGWAQAGNLSGLTAKPDAVPHRDGVANLLKYAFNLNAGAADARVLPSGAGNAGLPLFTLMRTGSQPVFQVEFLRRKGSGLIYRPQVSSDLVNFQPMTGTTIVQNLDAKWDRVMIRSPYNPTLAPKLFGKVEVMMP